MGVTKLVFFSGLALTCFISTSFSNLFFLNYDDNMQTNSILRASYLSSAHFFYIKTSIWYILSRTDKQTRDSRKSDFPHMLIKL